MNTIKNYFLVGLRNLLANKLFSAINILGLAVGLAGVILIALFVTNETSYDKHWTNAENTYRVMRSFTPQTSSPDLHLATNAPQVAPLLMADFPELLHATRVFNTNLIVAHDSGLPPVQESDLYFADPNVHEIFDIPMLEGSWEGALDAPFEMVLSESMARRYFGDVNPVGETLFINNAREALVTGVMADITENSHLQPQAIVSIATYEIAVGRVFMESWGNNAFHTYLVTPDNYDIADFEEQIPAFLERHIAENANDFTSFTVIPVSDIHLHSHFDNEISSNGNIVLVYTFTAIAVMTLLIACFNFMNLSTARSMTRAKEVGMRKIMGANRKELIVQFLGETLLLTSLAVVVALGLTELVLPVFNNMLNLDLSLEIFTNGENLLYLLGLIVLVGVFAGSYPAFFLAELPIAEVLRGELNSGAKGEAIRKFLVVMQFAIAIMLIISSGVALTQIRYALDFDLGLNSERVAIYEGSGTGGLGPDYQTMKEELLRHPGVVSVTAANLMPSDQNTNSLGIRYETESPEILGMAVLNVDFDFFETFDINFVSGRSFDSSRPLDLHVEPSEENPATTANYILNESAARQLGWTPEESIGKWMEALVGGPNNEFVVRGNIIGVVEDIYFSSIREAVKPVFYRVMEHDNPRFSVTNFIQMAVKLDGSDVSGTLNYINETWRQFNPGVPVRQSFLDQNYDELYQSEQTQGSLFGIFSAVAVVIAALGLFGLAAFLTECRMREIGIRKVLGSSVIGIVTLISKDFCKLVLIANLLAWPAAWYFMNEWLQRFVYRVDMSPTVFVLATSLTLAVAIFTVGSLAAITASRNPVLALRHE